LLFVNRYLLFKGVQYLNLELKIIHRDLKAANIFLVTLDNKIEVRIGDFGHALNTITNLDPNYFHTGTVGWMVTYEIQIHEI